MSKYKGKEDKRQCVICGGKYVPNHVNQKYCGNVCRKEQDRLRTRARRNKMTKEQKDKHKQCSICNNSFTPNGNRQKYCSPACKDVAQKENMQRWNEENRDYKAEYSRRYRKGMTVEQRKKAKEAQRERDRKRHARNKPLKECPVCSGSFKTNENGAKHKYCSEHCAKEIRKKRNRERFRKENGLHNKYDYEDIKKCKVCSADISHMRINTLYCGSTCRQRAEDRRRGHKPMEEHLAILDRQKEQRKEKLKREQHQRYLERLTVKECEWCGSSYETDILNQKTCSKECRRKRRNYRSSLIKDERIPKSQIVDRDISLERLYKRDKGICYLCNEKCDYSDIKITKDGHKYAGPTYPSTDHVMPVVHGGLHAWDNVRLAHHGCNSIKSDTIPDNLKELLPDDAYSVARKISPRMKTTLQFDLDGNLIATYESTAQAERETGFKRRGIQNNARGETKTYKGYKWEYV